MPLVAGVLFLAGTSIAAELKAETVTAFDKFIASAEARLEPRFSGRSFLWSDEIPSVREQLRNGLAVAQPVQGSGIVQLKGGLVQDWKGAIFIPRATLPDVLAVVQDFNHHPDTYKGDVTVARILSRQGDDFLVFMRVVKSKFMLTDVLNTEQSVQFVHVDGKRAYSRAYSKRINEVVSAGRPDEHELPVGQDRGYLWRMYGYWFFEERDGGVYIGCESVTLTREVPFGMGAVLGPIVNDLPGEALKKSLEQTRQAVISRR